MAEEVEKTGETATEEPNGTEETVDYKAKYEDVLKHSREWERKAKANKAAADELEKLKTAQLSEDEKRTREIEQLKAENERYRIAEQRREWVAQVSKETGVPADVLNLFECTDADDLKAKAESVAPKFQAKTVPAVPGDGIHATPKASSGPKADFAAFMESNFKK